MAGTLPVVTPASPLTEPRKGNPFLWLSVTCSGLWLLSADCFRACVSTAPVHSPCLLVLQASPSLSETPVSPSETEMTTVSGVDEVTVGPVAAGRPFVGEDAGGANLADSSPVEIFNAHQQNNYGGHSPGAILCNKCCGRAQ